MEFNTIKIEDLYFQEGEKQRDNCDAVISAVSTALGVNFTNNYFVLIRQTPWGGYNTVYTTAQQNCPLLLWKQPQVCKRFCFHDIISTPQAVSICSDTRKSWWDHQVWSPMRDGGLKSVWDEEQRIKHIEEMEQKCIQVCDCVCNHWLGSKLT